MVGVNYAACPVDYMKSAVERYIEHGIPPGDFLTAVICNDLKGAFVHADGTNQQMLKDWVIFFYNEIPHAAWGSRNRMQAWMELKAKERRDGMAV